MTAFRKYVNVFFDKKIHDPNEFYIHKNVVFKYIEVLRIVKYKRNPLY